MRTVTLDRRIYVAQLLARAVAAGLLGSLWDSCWSLLLALALTWGIEWLVPIEPATRHPGPGATW